MTAFFQICGHLPLWFLRALGSVLGIAIWLVSPAYRRMYSSNWLLAMGTGHQFPKLRAVAQAGQMVTELPKIWCDPSAAGRMEIRGLDVLNDCMAQGRGAHL